MSDRVESSFSSEETPALSQLATDTRKQISRESNPLQQQQSQQTSSNLAKHGEGGSRSSNNNNTNTTISSNSKSRPRDSPSENDDTNRINSSGGVNSRMSTMTETSPGVGSHKADFTTTAISSVETATTTLETIAASSVKTMTTAPNAEPTGADSCSINTSASDSVVSSSSSCINRTLRVEAAGWVPSDLQQNGLQGGENSSTGSMSPYSSSLTVPFSSRISSTAAGPSIVTTTPTLAPQASPSTSTPATATSASGFPLNSSSSASSTVSLSSTQQHPNSSGSVSGLSCGRLPRSGTHPRYHQGGCGYHQGTGGGGKFGSGHDGGNSGGASGHNRHQQHNNRQQQQQQHPSNPQTHSQPPPQPPPPQQQQGGLYCPPSALNVGGPYVMDAAGQQVLYVQMGETVYFQMGDTVQCIPGPATVRMVTGGSAGVALPPVVAIPQPSYDEMLQFHRPPQFVAMHPHTHPIPPQVASISNPHHNPHHGGPHLAPPFMGTPLPGTHQLSPPPPPPGPHQLPLVPHQPPVSSPYENAAGATTGGTPQGSPRSPTVSYTSSTSSGGSGASPVICAIEPKQQHSQKQQQQAPPPTATQVSTPITTATTGGATGVQQRQSPLLQTPTQVALSHLGGQPSLVLQKGGQGQAQSQPSSQGQPGGHRWDGGHHPHHMQASGGRPLQRQQQQHMQHIQHHSDSNSLYLPQDGAMTNGGGNRERGARGGSSPHGGSHGHEDGLCQPGMMHHGQQNPPRYGRPAPNFGDERSHRQYMKLRKKLESRTYTSAGGVTTGGFIGRGQKDDSRSSNNNNTTISHNNASKCNGGTGTGAPDNNVTNQPHHYQQEQHQHGNNNTNHNSSGGSNKNNGHQLGNSSSSNVGSVHQQAVVLTTTAAISPNHHNKSGNHNNNNNGTSNSSNNLGAKHSFLSAASAITGCGHPVAITTKCNNQSSLMPNSVILSATGGSVDKENVRGGSKGCGGHKVKAGGQGAQGYNIGIVNEENLMLSESNNNQVIKKGNSKANAEMELRELLTCVTAPAAVDVHARSALLSWNPPDPTSSRMGQHNFITIDVAKVIPPGEKNTGGARERERIRLVAAGRVREFRLEGLTPATDYQVAVQAVSDKIKGTPSSPCVFETLKCEPSTPLPPKLVSRTKNTLELKWLSTPDNGAKVTEYVLLMTELKASVSSGAVHNSQEDCSGESQERQEGQLEVYRGPNKNFKVSRLAQNTTYQFRVSAVNSVGSSEPSQPVCYSTCGAAPPRPDPPQLVRLGSDFIELRWDTRNNETYGLYLMQDLAAHGFVAIFNGKEGQYRAGDLCRSTKYCFKLNAQNEDGTSVFSNVVSYETRAEVPGKPGRPSPTSKVTPRQCVLSWSPPGDSGGAPVQGYCLEMCPVARHQQGSQPPSEFQLVYTGTEHRTLVGNLQPGSTYRFRVSCYSEAGQSAYSEPSCVCTPCECPGQCGRPSLLGKPKAHWMKVRWNGPENDGGGAVYQYELKLCKIDSRVEFEEPTPSPSPERTLRDSPRVDASQPETPSENGDSPWLIGYKGPDQETLVLGLVPGSRYRIKVRAFNAAGPGPWSEVLSTESGPGCPASINNARVESNSGGTVTLAWDAPFNDGGAQVTCYVVEHKEGSMDMTDYALKSDTFGFTEVSRSEATSFEMRGLSPNTTQNFRVAAVNSVGLSTWSSVLSCCTPAAVPAALAAPHLVHLGHISAVIRWAPPSTDGGARVERYIIDVSTGKGSTGFSLTKDMPEEQKPSGNDSDDDELEEDKLNIVVSPLAPETNYRVRVRAVNRVGNSAAGASLKLTTHCEPPAAPSLECSIIGHNFLKLVWRAEETGPRSPHRTAKDSSRDGKDSKFIQYSLEMVTANGATLLYQGPVTSFKVVRLKENSNYAFRIRASNLDSEGDWSPLVSFSTCFAPPAAPPAPRVEKVSGESEFIVDWAAATSLWKFPEPCQFLLELGEQQQTPGGVVGSGTGAAVLAGAIGGVGGTDVATYSPTERSLTWTEIYRGSEERTRISVAPGVFSGGGGGGADELRFVRLAQLRLVDIDTNIKSPYCQPVPLVGRAARAKALPKTTRPQAVADLASGIGAQHQHHHSQQHQQHTPQPQQLRRNSLQSAVVESAKSSKAISQMGDHHWAAILFLGFALAAILVAFLLEKFVYVSS